MRRRQLRALTAIPAEGKIISITKGLRRHRAAAFLPVLGELEGGR
jgi:hypothetical protein